MPSPSRFTAALCIALAAAACSRAVDRDAAASRPRSEALPVPDTRAASPSPALAAAPAPPALDDLAITRAVMARLRAAPELAGADISVNTDHGVVNLTGLVKSQEQAAVASSYAQRQDGVMRIEDHLAVDMR